MDLPFMFLGLALILFGLGLVLFNKKFTGFRINQRKQLLNKRGIHKNNKLFESADYFKRQRIQYYGVSIAFVVAGFYSILHSLELITEQVKTYFYIFLGLVGLITVIAYYRIKSKV